MISLHFEEVILEEALRPSKRIPDVIGITQSGERIIFEVRVTHEVDAKKRYEYRRLNMTSIEIKFDDLHHYLGDDFIISDELISEHLLSMPFEWLSIGPSGEIAKKYHDHEREQLKKIIKDNDIEEKRLRLTLEKINNTIAEREKFLLNFEKDYRYKQKKIENIELDINSLKNQINVLRIEKNEVLLTHQGYIEERISHFKNELMLSNQEYREQILQQELDKYRDELSLLEEKRDGLKAVIETYKSKIAGAEATLSNYNEKLNRYNEDCRQLEIAKSNFRNEKFEQDKLNVIALNNAKLITDIKRNLERIEQEVRPLCRRLGIPWPFSHSLLIELEN